MLVQQRLEGFDVVRPEGNMSSFNRVDDLPVLEGDSQVFGGKVHLHLAIGGKPDLTIVATARCGLRAGE